VSKIDDLLTHVSDADLREQLRGAVAEIKARREFGIVFEQHIPETVLLSGVPPRRGSLVTDRTGAWNGEWVVEKISAKDACLRYPRTGEKRCAPVNQLIVVKPFGEPIYPCLTPLGKLANGGERPWHSVINGENYHTLQLLLYLYEGKVDCIYIDPPFNSGATDWTYNNRFVDKNDLYRHSKWLSFMEKRLKLAKRLLKPDGVLVVAIDENEVHHLGMLLEHVFSDARRQMVSICINPSGVSGEGLSRVDEYAFFCSLGGVNPVPTTDDMLSEDAETEKFTIEWESLLRRGNAWYRKTRPNLCYPVSVDPKSGKILGVGQPFFGSDESKRVRNLHGGKAAWPVRKDGRLGIWRVDGLKLMELAKRGYAYVSSRDDDRDTWTIKYLMSGTLKAIEAGRIDVFGRGSRGEVLLRTAVALRTTAKTMWHRGRHTAGGAGGTQLLAALLGERDIFPFPKSVYAVRDAIAVAVGDRADALIMDFFAGSGTTLNATCLLNAKDNGRRRCILVTNNEVEAKTAAALRESGVYRGDPKFEARGIFERATRPRCEATITGNRPDGAPAEGEYLGGRPYAQGFEENVEFYRLDYLDVDEVSLGQQFQAIFPLLWMTTGGGRTRPEAKTPRDWVLPAGSPFGVLLDPDSFHEFAKAIAARADLTHLWIVTDDEQALARMRAQLRRSLRVAMLYRNYLRNFIINTDRNV